MHGMPAAQLQRALAEAAAARRHVDGQIAENRALREQQRILDDARLKDEAAIRDLTNELADRQEQVAAAQRKLVLMRSSRCGTALRSTTCMHAAAAEPRLSSRCVELRACRACQWTQEGI